MPKALDDSKNIDAFKHGLKDLKCSGIDHISVFSPRAVSAAYLFIQIQIKSIPYINNT